jgi:hypothetical protein
MVGTLVPVVSRGIMRKEQDVLELAMLEIRKREAPSFITQLFNRLLELPLLFLENIGSPNYRNLCGQGLEDEEQFKGLVLRLDFPGDKKIWEAEPDEIFPRKDVPISAERVTLINLDGVKYALAALGALNLRGRNKEDFFHFLELAEGLLHKTPHQMSTLTFLLHLQHWIRSEERDIKVVFQYIIDNLIAFMHADFGTLALLDRQRKIMMFVSQAGKLINPINRLRFESKGEPDSILSWVARNNQPYLAKDVRIDPFYKAFDPTIRSEMCVPI